MRVAMVCGAYQPGKCGVSDYTARLVHHLRQVGVEVTVVGDAHTPPEGTADRSREARWNLRGAVGVAGVVRSLQPDLVHVQFAPSAYGYRGAVGLLPLLLGSTRLVTTVHEYGWWAWRPDWFPEGLARRLWQLGEGRAWWDRETLLLAPRSHAVVATNDAHRRAIIARFPTGRLQVFTVPIGPNVDVHPVDRDKARRSVRDSIGAPATAPLLAFFGFVHPVKGVEYLLEATALLRTQRPDLHALVIGGFESLALRGDEASRYRRRLEASIRTLGLQGAVHLTGFQPEAEVSRLLQAADVAVFPFNQGVTLKSGSLLAALAHGLPTVATAPDPPEPVLVDGRHVLLVPRRDAQALARAVERALTDPPLAARLSAHARALAADHRWERIASAHLVLYRDLLRLDGRSRERRGVL